MAYVSSNKITAASGQKKKSYMPSCPMSKGSNRKSVSKTPESLDRPVQQTQVTSLHLLKHQKEESSKADNTCCNSRTEKAEVGESRVHQPKLPKGTKIREEGDRSGY